MPESPQQPCGNFKSIPPAFPPAPGAKGGLRALRDLILLQDICLERELRYDRRAAEAEERGDHLQAERERRLKERFREMDTRIRSYLRSPLADQ